MKTMKTDLEPWKTMKTNLEPWKTNLEPWKTMKTDLEVEVQVDLRQLGKVLIFRDKQNLPIIYRLFIIMMTRNMYTCLQWSRKTLCKIIIFNNIITVITISHDFAMRGHAHIT